MSKPRASFIFIVDTTVTKNGAQMALLHLHYLLTAFGLTVWTHAPAVVLAVIWALQAFMFIAGIDVVDLNDYIFWQFLTTLVGVLVGFGMLIVTRVPRLLLFKASYIGNWGQFMLWIALFVAAQLFYAFFPPPGQAWGLVGTVVATIAIQVMLWILMLNNNSNNSDVVFVNYQRRGYFFLAWLVLAVVMELMFFVTYVVLERWAAYISAAVALAILLVMALVFPPKDPYKISMATSGEPFITPNASPAGGYSFTAAEDVTY